jgi:pyridoxal phosphate enzyme (YggS family)
MLSTPQNLPLDETLAQRLAALRLRIATAAAATGRDAQSITLLAVTKGQSVAQIRAAMALGLTAFGENYADEALPKIHALRDTSAQWHFIGHLQANKTRAVAEQFAWVHGIERLKIAERLSAQRPHDAPALNVCVQVNIANDPSKYGVTPEQVLPLLHAIRALPRLRLRGLMCMLPFDSAPPEQHLAFAHMRALLESARAAGMELDTLSMGMSDDLDAAVAEGATLIRIGTALFGPRS